MIDPKKLTIKYKDLLGLSSVNRYNMAKSGGLDEVINALTPTQLAHLFPDYYKRNLSQQSPSMAAALSGGGAGYGGGGGGSVTPNAPVNITAPPTATYTPWMKELQRKHPEIAVPTPQQTAPQQQRPQNAPIGSRPTGSYGVLADQRQRFRQELEANPELRRTMAVMMMCEVGPRADSESKRALGETMVNRGAAQGRSLEQILRRHANPGDNYYAPYFDGAFDRNMRLYQSDPKLQEEMNQRIEEILNGSNDSNLATDNGSAGVAARAHQDQTVTKVTASGETLSRKDRSEAANRHGAGVTKNNQNWVASLMPVMAEEDRLRAQGTQVAQAPTQAPQTAAVGRTPFDQDQSIAYLRQTGAFKENELKALYYKGGQDKLAQGIRDKLSGLPITPPASMIRSGWMKDERLKDLVDFSKLSEEEQLKSIQALEAQVQAAPTEQAQPVGGPRPMPAEGLLQQAQPEHPPEVKGPVPGSDIVPPKTEADFAQTLPEDLSGLKHEVIQDLMKLQDEKLKQAIEIIRKNGVEGTNKSYEQYGGADLSQINAAGFGAGKIHGQEAYSEKQQQERPTVGQGKMSFQGFDDEELKALSFDVGTGSSEKYPSVPYGTYSLSEQGIGSTIAGYYAKGGLGTQGEYGTVFNVGTPQSPTATGYDPKAGRGRSEIQIHSNINSDIRRLTSMGCITPTREQYPQLVNGLRKAMKAAGGNVALVVESDGQGGQKFTVMPANKATNPVTVAGAIKNLQKTGSLSGEPVIAQSSYKIPDDLSGLNPQAQKELSQLPPDKRDYVEQLIRREGVEQTNQIYQEKGITAQSVPYEAGPNVGRLDQAPSSKELKGENLAEKFPQGTQRLFKAGGNLEGINPKLVEVLKEASKDLPAGYRVNMISGKDSRASGTMNHPGGVAMDVKIVGPDGREINHQGFGEGHKIYEQLAQSMDIRGQQMYPGTKYIWGGAWKSSAAGYGDRMHYQIVDPEMPVPGASKGSGPYNFQTGINPNFPEASAYMPPEELQAYREQIAQRYQQEQEQIKIAQQQTQAPPTASVSQTAAQAPQQMPQQGELQQAQPQHPAEVQGPVQGSDVVLPQSEADKAIEAPIPQEKPKQDIYGPVQEEQSSGGFWGGISSFLGFAKGGETPIGANENYVYVGPKPFIPEDLQASTTAYTLDNQGVYDHKGNLLFTKRTDENIKKLDDGQLSIQKTDKKLHDDKKYAPIVPEVPLQPDTLKSAETEIKSYAFGGQTQKTDPASVAVSQQFDAPQHSQDMNLNQNSQRDTETGPTSGQNASTAMHRDSERLLTGNPSSPTQVKYFNQKTRVATGGMNFNLTGNETMTS